MLKTLLVFVIGLIPPLLSVWLMRQAEEQGRERLRRAIAQASRIPLPTSQPLPNDQFIGDISCQFNAHSPYIRCAIKPLGPCEDCPHYQPRK